MKLSPRMIRIGLALLVAIIMLAAIIPFAVSRIKTEAAATQPLMVYNNGLSNNWQSWSWGSTTNFNNSSPVYPGSQRSISVSGNYGWSGLALRSSTTFSINQYAKLSFVAYASQPGLHYQVSLYDQSQNKFLPAIPLTRYGGDPVQGSWKKYTIPLTDLGGSGTQISRILIQNATNHSQAALYVDQITLLTFNQPTGTPTVGSTPVVTNPTGTPSVGSTPVSPSPTGVVTTPSPVVGIQGGGNAYFSTLPVGSALPSDQECAARVRKSSWEPRPDNYQANNTKPAPFTVVMSQYGPVSQYGLQLIKRLDGNFTGTTDEILQWGACKWGFDENILRAQAVQESDWHQSHVGDNGESFGILQVKRTYVRFTYPDSINSTAFNVDYMLAIRRICFEGGNLFIGNGYHAGDEWGCLGNWYSGSWNDSGAQGYIARVKARLQNQDWNRYGAGSVPMPGQPISPSQHADTGVSSTQYANIQQPNLVADIRRL